VSTSAAAVAAAANAILPLVITLIFRFFLMEEESGFLADGFWRVLLEGMECIFQGRKRKQLIL
jgi:hypothetical protein